MLGCFCCSLSDDTSPTNKNEEERQESKLGSNLSASSKWTTTANSTTHRYLVHDESNSSHSCNFLICGKYEVLNPIGKGSFGTVYHGKDIENNRYVAIKILKQKGHQSYYRETNVLQHLREIDGIPKIFWKGRIGNRDILIITRLGYDISMLFEYCNHSFSMDTTLKLGIKMIELIQKVHERGIIHRDIKPHNFLVGFNNDKNIYIIDFGLAKSYINSTDKIHKKQVTGLMPVGTARYASIWTHRGISQSRRDDLESIGFVLIYFLKNKLPWQGLKINTKNEKWQKIMNAKINTKLDELCHGLPVQFEKYLQYVRNLKYFEKPNYQYLTELFKIAANQQNIDLNNVVWDWDKK